MPEAPKACARFFSNRACEYFPCHPTEDTADFNCLFCYCPLYTLPDCGGAFRMLESGIKDCSACLLPHKAAQYETILARLRAQGGGSGQRKNDER